MDSETTYRGVCRDTYFFDKDGEIQVADFCGLHPLEVKGIADEDVAKGIKGQDPVSSGELTREQIEEAEKNPKIRLKMVPPKHKMPIDKQRRRRATRRSPNVRTSPMRSIGSCAIIPNSPMPTSSS